MGRIHSIQSLATLDGPGVRFAVFFQGCNLRCGCCHNPDTWNITDGTETDAVTLAEKAERYKPYFGAEGGITLSGGEPLLQAKFAEEIFRECKKRGINTCLDTSGSLFNDEVKDLLEVTDRVLLDIKYPSEEAYRMYVGCGIEAPLTFLEHLNGKKIPTVLRQVTVPSLNDTKESVEFLNRLAEKYSCVEQIELLPFQKICKVKYDEMGIPFPFENFPTPCGETMKELNGMIRKLPHIL